MKQRLFFLFAFFCIVSCIQAKEIVRTVTENVAYYSDDILIGADDYQKSQCRLDISAPKDAGSFPVLIWFHGGGLTSGKKHFPDLLKNDRIVLVAAGYRLAPQAKFPEFLEDAAAAVAWTFANIEQYGGNSKKIFIGGNSAGGYLSGMVGLDPRWLKPHGLDQNQVSGLILLTGQMTTHFHVRKMLEYKQPEYLPVVDENAPMFYLNKDVPPIALVVGDRKIEWPARVQENELMAAALKAMKHTHVEFHENPGYDHGKISSSPEAFEQIRQFIAKVCDGEAKTKTGE